jgi:hypothetical protein
MLKKGVITLALTGGLIIGVGTFSNANAQNPRWDRRDRVEQPRGNGGYGPIESTGNIDRNKNGIDDRYEANGQVDLNQNGIPDNQENSGRYGRDAGRYGRDAGRYGRDADRYGRDADRFDHDPAFHRNDGYFGNRGYNNGADYDQGYRDGLSRGRDDARTHRAMTPNNSEHYRNGNPSYRAGFEKGFYEAYRQNSGRRW